MTFKQYTLCSVLTLLILWGCQESPSPISEVDPVSPSLMSEFTAHMLTPSAFSDDGLSRAERNFIAKHSVEDLRKMAEVVREFDTWEDIHEGMLSFLKEPSQLPNYIREQRVAVFMLRSARSLEDLTEYQREVMGMYIDMLAKYRSPESALVLESLRRLEGFWPEEKIRYAASRSVEGADTYLDLKYYCAECPAGKLEAITGKSVIFTKDVFIREILGSIEALRLLSESPQG